MCHQPGLSGVVWEWVLTFFFGSNWLDMGPPACHSVLFCHLPLWFCASVLRASQTNSTTCLSLGMPDVSGCECAASSSEHWELVDWELQTPHPYVGSWAMFLTTCLEFSVILWSCLHKGLLIPMLDCQSLILVSFSPPTSLMLSSCGILWPWSPILRWVVLCATARIGAIRSSPKQGAFVQWWAEKLFIQPWVF